MAFEKEIKEYEDLRGKYQTLIINKMDREEYIKNNEVLFSTFSCAIEGNSFSVDDTRELKEKEANTIYDFSLLICSNILRISAYSR